MRLIATFLLTAGLALAQLDSDTITIVSRSPATTVPPGSIAVNLQITVPVEMSLDDVLAAVSTLGLTERDLVIANAPNFTRTWGFQFTTPLAGLKDTLAKLSQAGSTQPKVSVSYSVYSADTSAAPDCAYPTLISQARRYAENVATAAGVRLGRIVALADAPAGGVGFPTAVARIYDPFVGIPLMFASPWFDTPAPVIPTSCGVAVQFQLLR
jgi:hypothetical protein